MPTNFIYFAVEVCYTKLYLNSFLAMMNTREKLRLRNGGSPHALNNLSSTIDTSSFGRRGSAYPLPPFRITRDEVKDDPQPSSSAAENDDVYKIMQVN
ncbi:hypothetical protein PUNSTDRAFT_134360 [Punctularia strigosozonata HHB-11173 SS5]|uniref:uncharacterized protein n=1 Tax=Punctularia strigosozonata (strain HHB-11173) TaxID=741275 RepID=UPI00044181D4|nr:uncharacterized protein PUNSTDRAFT_134360 [Punctularia strigosozonata HHB-11173 SS5]EIN09195.1 hypothetical protein PUNSTDRAFT_134360 [Punctularia strigosozonata HHB-11173 SS5]